MDTPPHPPIGGPDQADGSEPRTVLDVAAPAVSILIVAYNSADLIAACINSIAPACTAARYEVLMVDNGDGSTEALVTEQFPDVRVIASRGNIGFAGGNNLLAKAARSNRLLLVNPDVVLFPGTIDRLLDGAQSHPDAAAWGGVTVDADGNPDAGNAIAMPSLIEFASVAAGRSRAGQQAVVGLDRDAKVPVLMGGFVMFSREAWETAGGLDERFFLYCEEVDLFYRLDQMGYSFWRIPAAKAYHAIAHGNNFSPLRLLYRAAGTMEFVRHHWSWAAGVAAFLLIWIAALVRFGAGTLLGAWRPNLRKMAAGYRRVALWPSHWAFGYDPKRGLMRHLSKTTPKQN